MKVQQFYAATVLSCAVCFMATAFSGCGGPDGNAANGKRWYAMNNCSACHGPNGNDGRAVDIANLDMSFRRFVNKLRKTDAPVMPPFPESKVSEQDAADIYAYLKSIK